MKFANLKFILTRSVGFSHIDLNYCKEHNIFVFNTPHYGDSTVAEFTFGILLSVIRNIEKGAQGVKKDKIEMEKYTGIELFNKTMGVIGAGSIGKNVLDIAKGFKMKTLAYDPYPSGDYNFCPLEDLIKNSDVISINSPLTKDNYHLVNKQTISKMKDGVVIVNTARSELTNIQDLIEGIETQKIGALALDVFDNEDEIYHHYFSTDIIKNRDMAYLRQFPNVILTQHMAFFTDSAVNEMIINSLNNLLDFYNTGTCKNEL